MPLLRRLVRFLSPTAVVVLGAILFARYGPHTTETAPPLTSDEELAEAVVKRLTVDRASADVIPARVYFVSLGDETDPSGEFFRRFEGYDPPIKPGSCASDAGLRITEKSTGIDGVLIRIKIISWVSPDAADVDVDVLERFLASGGYRFRCVRTRGRWKVESVLPTWSS